MVEFQGFYLGRGNGPGGPNLDWSRVIAVLVRLIRNARGQKIVDRR
jgi:hypothetical protein